MKTKYLAVGIILLFVGVTIAPTINFNTVKASQEDDLVEVTTQACGIKGYGDTTVRLTREQYQDLEQYFVEFRARLNQTITREEAVPIFKEAVVELEKYGLLPRGMSVERAQKLVMGKYQNRNIMKLQEKLFHSHTLPLDNNSNYLCLISGRGTGVGIITIFWAFLISFYYGISFFAYLLFSHFPRFINFLVYLTDILYRKIIDSDFIVSRLINIDADILYNGYGSGWVYTIGLNGVKVFSGHLLGELPYYMKGIRYLLMLLLYYRQWRGASFFNGIKMLLDKETYELFYIGTALQVRIVSV